MALFKDGEVYRTFDEQLAFLTKQVKDYHMVKIEKTSTIGLVDNYTITYQDGRTGNFQITNGNGIENITKTSTVGLVDTYTILFENGSTTTFTVTNGAKGDKGDTGAKGDTGDTGPKGDKGDKGDTGDTGAKGDKGDKGDTGNTGAQGVGISTITANQVDNTVTVTVTLTNSTTQTFTFTSGGSSGPQVEDLSNQVTFSQDLVADNKFISVMRYGKVVVVDLMFSGESNITWPNNGSSILSGLPKCAGSLLPSQYEMGNYPSYFIKDYFGSALGQLLIIALTNNQNDASLIMSNQGGSGAQTTVANWHFTYICE